MSNNSKVSRREFIRLATVGIGSLSLITGCSPEGSPGMAVLSGPDAAMLGAIADRIIPADRWPGGRENGVVTFIDRQLAGPYRRLKETYRKGLDAVSDTCVKRFGKRFEALSPDAQDGLLREMERGDAFNRRFFELLRSHAMQAYYGSPRHGGNPDYASYKMMGIDYPPIIGQNRYRL